MEFMVAWVVCSVLAFFVNVSDSRRMFDVTVSDAVFFLVISIFGPISLCAASLSWIAGIETGRKSKVLWRRK